MFQLKKVCCSSNSLGLFTVSDIFDKYGGDGLSPQSTNELICDRVSCFLLVIDVKESAKDPKLNLH